MTMNDQGTAFEEVQHGHKGRNAISLKSVAVYEEKAAMPTLSRVCWWCIKKRQQCPFFQESGDV